MWKPRQWREREEIVEFTKGEIRKAIKLINCSEKY